MKKLLAILAVACVLGIACANWFNRFVHPDYRFFLKAAEVSDRWASRLDRRAGVGRRYILFGGSEARFGIDPAILAAEYGMASVNAGMTAGFGISANMVMALAYARPGDVLIGQVRVSGGSRMNVEGIRALFYREGVRAFSTPLVTFSPEIAAVLARTHSKAVNLYVARRLLMPDYVYRYYNHTQQHESGWVDVQYTDIQQMKCEPLAWEGRSLQPEVTEEFRSFTRDLFATLAERQVELWVWFSPELCHPSHRVKRALEALALVRIGYKVLRDDTFNTSADGTLFSDRVFHASAKGTRENTCKLGRLIQKPVFWTEPDLVEWLHLHGWDEQGRPLPPPGDSSQPE